MAKPSILVLGTAHLNNPDNGDLFKIKTDDILSEHKQLEIKGVVDSLKKFEPTKIALEILPDDHVYTNKTYNDFLLGEYELTRNEYHQIGFRLAKEMNHKEVFCVDWNNSEPDIPDIELWTKEHASEKYNDIAKELENTIAKTEDFLRSHSIRDFLLYLNHNDFNKANQKFYMNFALMGNKSNPVGAMWTAKYWYYRNLLIYKNIVELIESDAERIFVLYGAGHIHLLNQFINESELFEVHKVIDYI
ncbi:DUF5694 domain-containing protein [Bacillus sp. AFS017336]|uniref:DUF5694 domain-containing protein n=1 Tax=Bacillus sp. AFS017336 TaxID=2033489 RepID=UPI000BF143ED|nr:DUF5694 domain-containing protein [Bacillus sp. AFS017336]PEL07756.1 hypothetical protein CN601_18865 [Bacillus sp. AFS017336]